MKKYWKICFYIFIGVILGATPAWALYYTGGDGDGYASGTSESAGNDNSPHYLDFFCSADSTGSAISVRGIPNTLAGANFNPQPVVCVKDAYGNTVSPASASNVTLYLYSNAGNGTLDGTTTKSLSNGAADFSGLGLNIDEPGDLYSLKASVTIPASEGTVYTGVSNSFQVLPLTLKAFHRLRSSPSTSGLVGYWAFDEGQGITANDSSGNGNTGTLTNGPTWGRGHTGSEQ